MAEFQVAQGDLLFVLCDESEIPANAKPVARQMGRLIVAEGEATGHHHAIADKKVELLTPDGVSPETTDEAFLRIVQGATLTHEEHASITFDPGTYKVIRQTEYTPEVVRRVAD